MNIGIWHTLFIWVGIIAGFFTALSTLGIWLTGKVIEKQKDSEIAELQIKVVSAQPRILTSEQKDKLISILSSQKGGKVGFIVKIHDSESKNYAEQLLEAFKLAGWQVMPSRYDLLDDFNGKINIFMTGQKVAEDVSVFLVSAFMPFDQTGILYQSETPRVASFGGGIEENTLYLEIGAKK